jgi:hypothetical protein
MGKTGYEIIHANFMEKAKDGSKLRILKTSKCLNP